MKGTAALRYMDDPTKDGYSRGHVSEMECTDEEVHRTSGIFNKVITGNRSHENVHCRFFELFS